MDSVEITLKIYKSIEKALNLGYNKLYVNVDDLENGFGFLRLLAMHGSKDIIIYEETLKLETCYKILDLIEQSEYDVKDFTIKL